MSNILKTLLQSEEEEIVIRNRIKKQRAIISSDEEGGKYMICHSLSQIFESKQQLKIFNI